MAVIVNQEACDACKKCVEVCPTEAISVEEHAVVKEDECNECGACVDECPNEALSLP